MFSGHLHSLSHPGGVDLHLPRGTTLGSGISAREEDETRQSQGTLFAGSDKSRFRISRLSLSFSEPERATARRGANCGEQSDSSGHGWVNELCIFLFSFFFKCEWQKFVAHQFWPTTISSKCQLLRASGKTEGINVIWQERQSTSTFIDHLSGGFPDCPRSNRKRTRATCSSEFRFSIVQECFRWVSTRLWVLCSTFQLIWRSRKRKKNKNKKHSGVASNCPRSTWCRMSSYRMQR